MHWFWYSMSSFVLAVLSLGLLVRVFVNFNRVFLFLGSGGVIGIALVGILFREYGFSIRFISGSLCYAGLCELYIFLFTMVGTSISATLLTKCAKGTYSLEKIDQLFSSEFMVESRINTLEKRKFIKKNADQEQLYILTEQGQRLVRHFVTLQSFFNHRS